MVKIQLDLNDNLNKKVEIIRAVRGLYDKRQSIKFIIEKYNDPLFDEIDE